jgi:hypothetical protein
MRERSVGDAGEGQMNCTHLEVEQVESCRPWR